MTPHTHAPPRPRFPLVARVLLAAVLGAALGACAGARSLGGISAADLGEAGMLVIRALKVLATPLVFFAVADAALRLAVPARKAALLVGVAIVNAAVAVTIGLSLAHTLRAGEGAFRTVVAGAAATLPAPSAHPLAGIVPASIVEPFATGSIVAVVVLALLFGLSLRAVRPSEPTGVAQAEALVRAALAACSRALGWLVALLPLAVFGVVAAVVAKSGLALAHDLVRFVAVVALGLAVHAVGWYGLVVWLAARRSPARFVRGAADALATAFSSGSSLATLPVTLRCLERMNVTPGSARLAACVGTNLNHAGIILYEAAAAIFVAQAAGVHLGVAQSLAVACAAVMAGVGIAGVPDAGLVTLPLVLGSAGIAPAAVAGIVPALLPVDWLLGRCRAATNVASDMVVAAVIDRHAPDAEVSHAR